MHKPRVHRHLLPIKSVLLTEVLSTPSDSTRLYQVALAGSAGAFLCIDLEIKLRCSHFSFPPENRSPLLESSIDLYVSVKDKFETMRRRCIFCRFYLLIDAWLCGLMRLY